VTLARHAGFASPVQPGPFPDGPVRARRSMTQDAFRRIWTPRCHVVPFVPSCPRIGLSPNLIDSAWGLRTLSPSTRRGTRQRCCDILPASAARPACLAAPRCVRREMRPIDFCFSSLVLRAPSPRGLPGGHWAFGPALLWGGRCFTTSGHASAGPSTFSAPGAFSSPRRIDATEPLTSLSLSRCLGRAFARVSALRESRRPNPPQPP
jgi:hypothetical protein